MMKPGKEKAASFLILFSCLFFANSLYAQENAAEVYQKASSLFSDVSPFPHEEINKIIKNGWNEDNEGLKEILTKNKEAIEEFKKATKIVYCDFHFGKPVPNDLREMGPSHLRELHITKLMLLEAKLFERENKFDMALERYLAITQYVKHLEQQEVFILFTKATAWATEELLYAAIDGYLKQNEDYKVEGCQPLLNALLSLKSNKSKITLENAFEEERRGLRNTIKKLIDSPDFYSLFQVKNIEQNKEEQKSEKNAEMSQKKYDTKKPGLIFIKKVRQEIYKEYDKVDKEWHPYLVAAFRENNCSALRERFKQLGSFKFTPFTWFIYTHPYLMENSLFQWMFPSTIAKMFSQIFIVTTPLYNRMIARHYISMSKLNILIIAAAIKIYELEKSKAIDNLQELVPAYLEKISEDPFDGFKPLKYEKKENGWVVYSFGPDKQDDHAALEIDEEARNLEEEKGDIVFQSF